MFGAHANHFPIGPPGRTCSRTENRVYTSRPPGLHRLTADARSSMTTGLLKYPPCGLNVGWSPRPTAMLPPHLLQWIWKIVPLAETPPFEIVAGATSPQPAA